MASTRRFQLGPIVAENVETAWMDSYRVPAVRNIEDLNGILGNRILSQFRTKSENALRKGRTEAPFAYVVPARQDRPRDAAEMLRLLERQGIVLLGEHLHGELADVDAGLHFDR